MDDKKVLHIISSYDGNKLYKELLKYLSLTGVKSLIYVPKYSRSVPKEEGVYRIDKRHNKLQKFFHFGQQKYILKDIIRKINLLDVKLIHTHRLFFGAYASYKLKEIFNIPYVVAIRNSDANGFYINNIFLRNYVIKVLLSASKIVFISTVYKDEFIKNRIPKKYQTEIDIKSCVVHNGIDGYFLENVNRSVKAIIKNEINLICIGDINKNKNQITIIEACNMLINNGYGVKLKLIGNIIEPAYFEKFKKSDFITYCTYCSKEEIINHLRDSDIFVMPSKTETFGLVYAEAMSQGVPIIYTRGQGFDGQYREGEVGYSVRYDDAREIATNILKIYENYQEISENCVKHASRYDWAIIAKKYSDIYAEILNEYLC